MHEEADIGRSCGKVSLDALRSQSQLGLFPECRDECRSLLHGLELVPGGVAEVIETVGAEVGQAVLLEIGPEVFHRVESRGVGGRRSSRIAPLVLSTNARTKRLRWAGTPSQVFSGLRPMVALSALEEFDF